MSKKAAAEVEDTSAYCALHCTVYGVDEGCPYCDATPAKASAPKKAPKPRKVH